MKALWKKYTARFDGFSLRERRMIALACWGGLLLVAYSALIEPQLNRIKSVRQSLAQQSTEQATLQGQLVQLQAQLKGDPDAAVKEELRVAQAELKDAGDRINAFQSTLLPPEAVKPLLEKILKRYPGLRLASLKTLPPESLLPEKSAKSDKDAPKEAQKEGPKEGQKEAVALPRPKDVDLYRHGVEIRIEGSYPDLAAYLSALEGAGQQLLWSEARLQVVDYPKSALTLVFHTLSSEKAWLAL